MPFDPKSVARAFVEALAHEPLDRAVARFGDENTIFWILGMGVLSPQQLAGIGAALAEAAAGPATMIVHDVIADGNKVAVEAESRMPLKNSTIYNNKYHFKIIFENEKISQIREYGDTKHVHDIFGS
ncbi:hypothetical protein SAMIE_1033600 [Sphingobium amiense]|uniref:SnoaL-like domain-containing protein n=1 Tax=Sphingobium amiense TaxID=135719 RepID=A0A494WGH0_9SPHN|nr:hypothetical protein [Sphingobium amiense]BBD99859.1 hypothetical protein SAMIE_1033600 [Sphingobium amiense]